MSNSKQNIISELKSKITQFKSKFKSNKITDEKKENEEKLILNFLYKKNNDNIIKENNETNIKENINNNTLNKPIKTNKIERANSTDFSSYNYPKKFVSFDADKILNPTKKLSHSKTNINNLDLFDSNKNKNNNKNKAFINLDLNQKKIYPKTDRKKVLYNRFNTDFFTNYEENFSEPNIDSYKKTKTDKNYFNFNYPSKDNTLFFTRNKSKGERFNTKPEIRTDVSKYNLNFMIDNKKTKEKNIVKLFDKNNDIDIYSMNIKNILYNNKRKNNYNSINNLNNKYLKPSFTTYNYNCISNFNNRNPSKNLFNGFEDNKNNNNNLNMDDIHKIKYMIQNLSNEEIRNMPNSVFKEMKDLYELIYKKFLKNSCI